MPNTVISFPVPPFSNPPIQPEFYLPKRFTISAITLGITTTVTTTIEHDYVIGQEVRLIIPNRYGSTLLNEKTAIVLTIPSSTSVKLNLNSMGADPFIPSPTFLPFESKTLAQIIGIGDVNSGVINTTGRINTGTFIPGSFINISPL